MSTIKTGWLKDKNGDKFAPKTLSSQVIGSDGVNLEDKIQAQLDEFRNEMGEKDHNHDDLYETKEDANDKFAEGKLYTDTLISDKADKDHTHDLYETKTDAQLKYDELTAIKAEKNHSHSWNDLEDKPFGEEISDEEVLCEASLELGNDGQSSSFPQHIPLVLGETYQVIIDGVEYEPTICKEYKSMYATYNALGNASLHNSSYGEDTGENYLWIDNFAIYVSDRPNETVSVKLLGRGSTIVQLDEKYIPDTIARTTYLDENFALKSDLANIDLSKYETKTDSQIKLDEAKAYADSAASTVKDDLLNGAGDAYDTLLELGELIDENHDAIDALEIVASNKSDKGHTHTMESIEGLQDAVNAAADSKFYVVTFDMGDDNQYHGDLTFAQIREKFEAGGNMVARIDGTDYIPLLSAATHQIIFSGIYQATSVSLTVSSNDVCTLTSTSLARSNHNHPTVTTSTNGFMSSKDKIKLDEIDASKYETKEDAQVKYDEILANQFTVQMITWEADD